MAQQRKVKLRAAAVGYGPTNYDPNDATAAHSLVCPEESRAKQSFKEECDINTILKRFKITGQLPENVRMPTYDDFTEVTDFQTAMDAIVAARESFAQMPANVRARFHNDPAEFVDFCSNPDNRPEAARLGLVPPEPKIETEKRDLANARAARIDEMREAFAPPPKDPPKGDTNK